MSSTSYNSGYATRRAPSPIAVGGVIAVHLGLGALLMTLSGVTTLMEKVPTFITYAIPAERPPEPAKAQPQAKTDPARPDITTTKPLVETLTSNGDDFIKPEPVGEIGGSGIGLIGGEIIITPPQPPVLVDARPDARFRDGFQPPYPAAMLRMQLEGEATVRVLIDADGRVRDVLLVRAAHPAFFDATRQQALKSWRFVPATRDGVPVASERVMTVHFRLTE